MNIQNVSHRQETIEAEAETGGLDLREVLHFAWRQWKFIGAIVVASMLVGLIQLARQVPVYTATTQLLLDPRKEKAAGNDAILTDQALDAAAIESQLAVIRSVSLLRRVVEKERLTTDPEFGNASIATGGGLSLLGSIRSLWSGPETEQPAKPSPALQQAIPPDVLASALALGGSMTAVRTGQGYMLSISVTSVDPGRAARLANAVADAFAVDKLDARFDAARRASGWLDERLDNLRTQLRESEQAVLEFRTSHGILAQNTGLTLNQQQIADLNTRLIAARSDTAEKKARYDLISGANGKVSVQNLPDVMNSGSLAGLRSQLNGLSQKEADLLARYSDKHPLVVNVRAERADVERSFNSEVQRLAVSVKNEYELAKAREETIAKSIAQGTGQNQLDNEASIQLRELERTAAVNKSLFEDFLQRAKVTEEQSTFEARDVRVIAPAIPPGSPSAPIKTLVLGIYLAVGLALGVGSAFAMEALNAGFTTPQQVEGMLKAPLLTSLSYVSTSDLTIDGKLVPLFMYPVLKPLSRVSESIRSLRSGIRMTDVDNPPKVVQFTSTMPSEGKTTIAMTTATSAAMSGQKVLVIDADLRHPSTSRLVGREKEKGLVDYLVGEVELNEVVKRYEPAGFWMLPAGGKTQNPPDLLASDKFKNLLDAMKKSFDLVVVDTPPIGPVIDASVVSGFVDKVVYVVKWAHTARELVQRAAQQLQGERKIAGIVYNSVNERRAQKYGKYAYDYYYGNRYYKKYYSE